MRHVHRLSVLVLGLVVIGLFTVAPPRVVYACSCIMPGTPQEELSRADAVFGGTVTSIERVDQMTLRVTFDVGRIWKGPSAPTLSVTTAGDSAACGYQFQPGAEYIVYATGQDGSLVTSLCSRTQPAASASDDLAILGEGAAPDAAPQQPEAGADGVTSAPTTGVPIRAIALWSGITLAGLLIIGLIVAVSRRGRRVA